MLIGHTLSLAKLEEHMEEKMNDNKMEMNQLSKKMNQLQQELQTTSKFVTDEKTGDRIVNSRYLEIISEFEEGKKKLEEISESNEFMSKRLEELAEIENVSAGRIDKEKYKLTLTLNDCLMLGVTDEIINA